MDGEVNRYRLFAGCFLALIATAFGFVIRATILNDWKSDFSLTYEQLGVLGGVGLFPFALSIILVSLFLDRVGYGRCMVLAWLLHVASAAVTIYAGIYLELKDPPKANAQPALTESEKPNAMEAAPNPEAVPNPEAAPVEPMPIPIMLPPNPTIRQLDMRLPLLQEEETPTPANPETPAESESATKPEGGSESAPTPAETEPVPPVTPPAPVMPLPLPPIEAEAADPAKAENSNTPTDGMASPATDNLTDEEKKAKDRKRFGYLLLYLGTFLLALGNGVVEAVINPVVATMFDRNKTTWLNILHAGWPGGLVLGGFLVLFFGDPQQNWLENLVKYDLVLWQWKVALVLLPVLLYGLLLLGLKFPVQERVAAGVSYNEMLAEFGAGGFFIVTFLSGMSIFQILGVCREFDWFQNLAWFGADEATRKAQIAALFAINTQLTVSGILGGIGALIFGTAVVTDKGVGSFGRPIFVILCLIMFLLATTELGVDSWIADIMENVLKKPIQEWLKIDENTKVGPYVLIYTSAIMFILRVFAGPIVHSISPLGLLALSAAIAAGGLVWISYASTDVLWMIFAAATLYGIGKSFFWPTTLGIISEQCPRGGALLLNAIAGVGMMSVGVLGGPLMGSIQDQDVAQALRQQKPEVFEEVTSVQSGMLGEVASLNDAKLDLQPKAPKEEILAIRTSARRELLAKMAILPGIMFLCYVALIIYYNSRGGYEAETLDRYGSRY